MTQLARDIMNPEPPHCLPDTPVETLIKRFSSEELTGILVMDEARHLRGLITESDLVEQQASLHVPTAMAIFDMILPLGEERFERELQRLQALQAADLMVREITVVEPDDTLDDIARLMSDDNIHHLPVVDGDCVVGLISRHEVIRALALRPGNTT